MSARPCSPGKPPWWPHNEPWPALGQAPHRRPGRRRFFRRAAALALLLLGLSVSGAVALVWLAATWLGMVAPAGPRSAAILFVGGMAGLGLAVVGLVHVMRRVAMPLGGVMDAADRVAAGNYDVRVAEQGSPPIRALARAFNAMTERLGNDDRLRRDLMADVAHELRTPLTVMQGKLEGLLDGVYPRDARQLPQLLEETHVLSRLVETCGRSRCRRAAFEAEGAGRSGGLARDAAAAFSADATARQVRSTRRTLCHRSDRSCVREVITNSVERAAPHAAWRLGRRAGRSGAGRRSLSTRDTGSGMTPEATRARRPPQGIRVAVGTRVTIVGRRAWRGHA